MKNEFNFNHKQFSKLFPFYIHINSQCSIISVGASLQKIYGVKINQPFSKYFQILRPQITVSTFASLSKVSNQMLILKSNKTSKPTLRGQVEIIKKNEEIIFLVSPWLNNIDELVENKLEIKDFALHDPVVDLLHLLMVQKNTTDDLKFMYNEVEKQKEILSITSEKAQSFALFSMQSPEPFIRFDLNGKPIIENSAAKKLTSFLYNNKKHNKNTFYHQLIHEIKNKKELYIEAKCNDAYYSFLCIFMKKEKYLNVYGRNITKEKEALQTIKNLNLVLEQNINAVIFTDLNGRITWVNKAFEIDTGFTLNEVIGKTPGSFLQGKDTSISTINYMHERIQKKLPFNCEILNYRKDNTPFWVKIKCQPIFNDNNEISHFFSIQEDITEIILTNKKINEFEKKISYALDTIGDNLWEYDFTTDKVTNYKGENIVFGRKPNMYPNIELAFKDIILAEDYPIYANIAHNYNTGKIDSHNIEYRIKDTDGSIKWIQDRGIIIEKDSNGLPLKLVGIHSDISENKFYEAEIAKQKDFYHNILNKLPADIAIFDKNQNYIFINETAIQTKEIREWLIGKNDFDYCAYRNKPIEIAIRRRKEFESILAEKKLMTFEETSIDKDGKQITNLRRYHPFYNQNGEIDIVIGYGINISELKEKELLLKNSEKKYLEIIQNTSEVVLIIDSNDKLTFMNQAAETVFAVNKKEFIGKNYTTLINHTLFSEHIKNLKEGIHLKKDRTLINILNKSNIIKNLFYYINKQTTSDYKNEEIHVFMSDVSDQMLAEEKLKKTIHQEKNLNSLKSNFVNMASHELRTPLSVILSSVELLEMMQEQNVFTKTNTSEQLNQIKDEINRMVTLMNELLLVSKIEAGKIDFNAEEIHINKFINSIIEEQFNPWKDGRTIAFVNSNNQKTIVADKFMIRHIILNLFTNAFKYSPLKKAPICSLSFTNKSWQISIEDFGIGIPKNEKNNLFKSFFRASNVRQISGTGIGLVIVKFFCEKHNGKISIKSDLGKGTKITLTFPNIQI